MNEMAYQKFRENARSLYMILTGFLFLWYVYVIARFNSQPTPTVIQILRCLSVILSVWLGQLWKERTWRILTAFWLLLFFRVLIGCPDQLGDKTVRESLFLALWLYSGCFGLARALPEKELKRFLLVCASVWIAAAVLYSLPGIYAAWTDRTVQNPFGHGSWKLDTDYGRLKMLFGYNQCAAIVNYTAMIALILLFRTKKKAARLLLVPALVILLLPVCLAGSRTGMYTFSLCLGGMAGMTAVRMTDRKKPSSGAVCWFAGAAVFAVTAVCTLLILSRVVPVFNSLKTNGAVISHAGAETVSAGTMEITERGLTGLTDREGIWLGVLQYLKENPMTLLTGTSLADPMAGPNALIPRDDIVPHAHNTLLHVLLESGIPGLLLILVFVILIGIRGARLVKDGRKRIRWFSLVPMMVFAAWAGEMADCFLIALRYRTPMQPILFVCMGIVSAYGLRKEEITQ